MRVYKLFNNVCRVNYAPHAPVSAEEEKEEEEAGEREARETGDAIFAAGDKCCDDAARCLFKYLHVLLAPLAGIVRFLDAWLI